MSTSTSRSPSSSPSLSPDDRETRQPSPGEELHQEDLHLSREASATSSSSPTVVAPVVPTASYSLLQQPTWDNQCECGGIGPHYHDHNSVLAYERTMNGTYPPTGPRGGGINTEAATTTGTPTSPATTSPATAGPPRRIGLMQNFVQVAKAYVFEQEIQRSLRNNGVSQAREDNIRLAGVQYIDNVRKALKL
jgi:hypothetical protein